MLSEIYLDGFRLFRDFRLYLKNGTTLLCGLNGSGKSGLIEIVNRLKIFIGFGETIDFLCPFIDIPVWENQPQGRFTTRLGLKLNLDGKIFNYEIEILHNLRDKLSRVEKESLTLNDSLLYKSEHGKVTSFSSPERQGSFPVGWNNSGIYLLAAVNQDAGIFMKHIQDNIIPVCADPAGMKAFNNGKEKNIKFDGSNFSAWYAWLESNRLKQAVDAMEDMARFFPDFKQFAFIEHGTSRELVGKIGGEMDHDYCVSFEQFSQGQKVLALFYMLIRTCPNNSTILIDEIENHISPIELQPLYDLANEGVEEKNIQFILVSHNHKTLNWYQAETIILKVSSFPGMIKANPYTPRENISIEDELMLTRGNLHEI